MDAEQRIVLGCSPQIGYATSRPYCFSRKQAIKQALHCFTDGTGLENRDLLRNLGRSFSICFPSSTLDPRGIAEGKGEQAKMSIAPFSPCTTGSIFCCVWYGKNKLFCLSRWTSLLRVGGLRFTPKLQTIRLTLWMI